MAEEPRRPQPRRPRSARVPKVAAPPSVEAAGTPDRAPRAKRSGRAATPGPRQEGGPAAPPRPVPALRSRGAAGTYDRVWSTGILTVGAIARRELAAYFVSPIGWAIWALMIPVVALPGWYQPLALQQPIGMDGVYSWVMFLLVFAVPFLTMRLLAEERRQGTLELVLTSPVRDWELVAGKWLGSLLFLVVVTSFVFVFVALLVAYQPVHYGVHAIGGISLPVGNVDLGPVLTGYIGLLLEASMLVAIGLLCSSLTENQIIAGFGGLMLTITLFYLLSFIAGPAGDIFQYLSAYGHSTSFNQGRLVLTDVVYYSSLALAALFLTTRVLESRKWRA